MLGGILKGQNFVLEADRAPAVLRLQTGDGGLDVQIPPFACQVVSYYTCCFALEGLDCIFMVEQ
jgi:hypothetical protein